MAGFGRTILGVALAFTWIVDSAAGFGGRWSGSTTYSYYSWPATYSYQCYPPVVRVIPLSGPCDVPPPPAPPTNEPPLGKQSALKPPLIEVVQAGSVETDRCNVTFWNLTGRDVILNVDGKSRALAKNGKLVVQTEREFQWQFDAGASHAEQVPPGDISRNVVVRD